MLEAAWPAMLCWSLVKDPEWEKEARELVEEAKEDPTRLLMCADVMEVCARGILLGWKNTSTVVREALRCRCFSQDKKRCAIFQLQYLFPYPQEAKRRLWSSADLMARAGELLLQEASSLPKEDQDDCLIRLFLRPWWLYVISLPHLPCFQAPDLCLELDRSLQEKLAVEATVAMEERPQYIVPPEKSHFTDMQVEQEELHWVYTFCRHHFPGVDDPELREAEKERWDELRADLALLQEMRENISPEKSIHPELVQRLNSRGGAFFGFTPLWYARDLKKGKLSVCRLCSDFFPPDLIETE